MTDLVLRKMIGGGVVKLERVQGICPACGEQVEAIATDGRVKGYCAVAKQHVDFLIETQLAPQSVVRIGNPPTAETRAKLSACAKKLWQDPEYRVRQIAFHTGRHPSPETRAKISASLTRWHNRLAPENRAKVSGARNRKPLTAETKAKLSAAMIRWHNRKRVMLPGEPLALSGN